jgi:hypothetical protein
MCLGRLGAHCSVEACCASGACKFDFPNFNTCIENAAAASAGQEAECLPATCESLGLGCGTAEDGCGGFLDCDACMDFVNSYCDAGTCLCAPNTCESIGLGCGTADDGCGGILDCGACPEEPVSTPAPELACFAEGERCVNDGQCCAGLCRGRDCRDRGTKLCQAACTA